MNHTKAKRAAALILATLGLGAAVQLSPAVVPSAAIPAQAAIQCAASGTVGYNPTLKNIGPRNPNTVRNGVLSSNYIYYGSPEAFCPTGIYVHSGYDIEIGCSNGVTYFRKTYGWVQFGNYCSVGNPSHTITLREYKQ